jgi:hypothetical protein
MGFWRYVKEAFWVRPRVPSLGPLPVLVLSAIGFGIVGVAYPPLWLLGLGLIGGATFTLSMNRRFRRLVDAIDEHGRERIEVDGRAESIRSLNPDAKRRLARLEGQCQRVLEVSRAAGADEITLDTTRDALDKLQFLFLKLLAARHLLEFGGSDDPERALTQEITHLERSLAGSTLSDSISRSRQATLELLRKRLSALQHREQSLAEVESDLRRIETQVALALDESALRGKPVAISANIDLTSQMIDFAGSSWLADPPRGSRTMDDLEPPPMVREGP